MRVSNKLDIFGPVIRKLPSNDTVYLTFDDGPCAYTLKVLNLLKKEGAQATFFMVANQLSHHLDVVNRILLDGHRVGNHSLDHRYMNFFKSTDNIHNWVKESEECFRTVGLSTIGFRSPVGIQTPKLHRTLKGLRMPMVHWSVRVFDAKCGLNVEKLHKLCKEIQPGDIVLLHDKLHIESDDSLIHLRNLIRHLKEKGYALKALPNLKEERWQN